MLSRAPMRTALAKLFVFGSALHAIALEGESIRLGYPAELMSPAVYPSGSGVMGLVLALEEINASGALLGKAVDGRPSRRYRQPYRGMEWARGRCNAPIMRTSWKKG